MTIALGFQVGDGMLLAADRQVTNGDQKCGAGKIALWLDPDPSSDGMNRGRLAITGAGDVHYLSAISVLLREPFTRSSPLTMDELESEFEQILVDFHQKHVIPFGTFREEDRPSFELIIAAQRSEEKRMWVTQLSSIVPVWKPVAVGCGSVVADELFQNGYFPQSADIIAAQIMAAYVIFRAKQTVAGCGHDTDFEIISTSEYGGHLDHCGVRELEDIFRRYARLEAKWFHQLFGGRPTTPEEVKTDEIREDVGYLVTEYTEAGFSRELLEAQRRSKRGPQSPPP